MKLITNKWFALFLSIMLLLACINDLSKARYISASIDILLSTCCWIQFMTESDYKGGSN